MRAFLDRLRPYAPLSLRLVLGALAISFALGKLAYHRPIDRRLAFGLVDFYKEVTAWGLRPWLAPLLAWGSLAGGVMLILGFLARFGALACAAVTVLVIVKTKLHAGFAGGLDFPLLTLAGCLSVLLSGAGRPSVDARLFDRSLGRGGAP